MAEEKPSLHIDNDWKRQAQEEKKRLVEEEAKKASETVAPAAPAAGLPPQPGAARGGAAAPPSFDTLVQSILTQIFYYLGELSVRGAQPNINLDMAKNQIDLLGILEEKTRNNLTSAEKQFLDTALYETRMRYVNVASQYT